MTTDRSEANREVVINDGWTDENSYAWFMRMRDGKVVDGTALR